MQDYSARPALHPAGHTAYALNCSRQFSRLASQVLRAHL